MKKATAVLTGYKLDRASRFSHCELFPGFLKSINTATMKLKLFLFDFVLLPLAAVLFSVAYLVLLIIFGFFSLYRYANGNTSK